VRTVTYQQFLHILESKWSAGQHITVIGTTGSGKTIAIRDILSMRRYLVVLATKAHDPSLSRYHLPTITSWPPDYTQEKVLVWKKPKKLGDFGSQQALVYTVMNDVFFRGGYTVYFDDLFYVVNMLHLRKAVEMLYTQVRSQGVSLVASVQRPSNVPLVSVNQASYLLVFNIKDIIDVQRVAKDVSMSWKELQAAIATLQKYEFLFLEMGAEALKVQKARI
jgi:hypothetical protein